MNTKSVWKKMNKILMSVVREGEIEQIFTYLAKSPTYKEAEAYELVISGIFSFSSFYEWFFLIFHFFWFFFFPEEEKKRF